MGVTGTHSDGVPIVALCVRRAGAGGPIAARHADEPFYAASTVKLAVLAAVAGALDRGEVTLDTSMVSTDTFRSEAPGAPDYRIDPDDVDPGLPPPGTAMPLGDVVERMIVVSSNEATNMLVELLGRDAVNAVLAEAGASTSEFGRKFSDAAAAALGGSHRTTAADLAALMAAVVTGRLASAERTSWMTSMLGRQQDRLLTAAAPPGVAFGSKSGSVTGIRHDVAFIGGPGPDALVVAVCTRGFDEPAAEEAIRAVGALAGALARARPGEV